MKNSIKAAYGYIKNIFKMICPCCGCEFKVETQVEKGHREREEFCCPECQEEYGCSASDSPTVTLLKRRTDGRIGQY